MKANLLKGKTFFFIRFAVGCKIYGQNDLFFGQFSFEAVRFMPLEIRLRRNNFLFIKTIFWDASILIYLFQFIYPVWSISFERGDFWNWKTLSIKNERDTVVSYEEKKWSVIQNHSMRSFDCWFDVDLGSILPDFALWIVQTRVKHHSAPKYSFSTRKPFDAQKVI